MNKYRVRFHCPVTLGHHSSVDFEAKSDHHAKQQVPGIAAETKRSGAAGTLERLQTKWPVKSIPVCSFFKVEELK